MGSVINRGTRDKPAWYGTFRDVDGRRKRVHTHMPTKEQAKRFIAAAEANVGAGKVGIPQPPGPQEVARRRMTVRDLGEKFTAEYAAPRLKDPKRYRKMAEYLFEKHLYPALGDVRAVDV